MTPKEIESKLDELEGIATSAINEANTARTKVLWLKEVLGRVIDNLDNPDELTRIREEIE